MYFINGVARKKARAQAFNPPHTRGTETPLFHIYVSGGRELEYMHSKWRDRKVTVVQI